MASTKKPTTRRALHVQRRTKVNVDPSRMALAAVARIRTLLVRSGHADRLAAPVSMKELAARAAIFGQQLPPSYVATLRMASRFGAPEEFIDADTMVKLADEALGAESSKRYVAFCLVDGKPLCFDKKSQSPDGEMPIVLWSKGYATSVARNFGEWLDAIADTREERMHESAEIPARLKQLLTELGFEFHYPIVGTVETSDAAAIEALIGDDRAADVRGTTGRLFDSSGRALLSLNVEDFSMTARLRTGVFDFAAEDTFLWLRSFRDENFFGESRPSSRKDSARDLRLAEREPPLILRNAAELAMIAAKRHFFVSAAGSNKDDFFLLGRTPDKDETILVHVQDGQVTSSRDLPEDVGRIHMTSGGTLWGLSTSHAVRIDGSQIERFPLARPTEGPQHWRGIGGSGERVFVWGAGALLMFHGTGFSSFPIDLGLDPKESVLSTRVSGEELSVLVCRDKMGAVARFDGKRWLTVEETQVLEGELADMDTWRGVEYILDTRCNVFSLASRRPARIPTDPRHAAFRTERNAERQATGLAVLGDRILIACEDGFIAIAGNEPLFYRPSRTGAGIEARVDRIGTPTGRARASSEESRAVVATYGPGAWVFRDDHFHAIDVRHL